MARNLPIAVGLALLGLASAMTGAGFVVTATGDAAAGAPDFANASLAPSAACIADFDRLVQPILNLRCVQCHQGVSGDAGLSLQGTGTAERIVLAPSSGSALNLVEPGRPEESYLYLKVTGRQSEANGMGARMPLIGDRLSDARLEVIRAWIDGCTVVPAV